MKSKVLAALLSIIYIYIYDCDSPGGMGIK